MTETPLPLRPEISRPTLIFAAPDLAGGVGTGVIPLNRG
jgi:hypothetical protein